MAKIIPFTKYRFALLAISLLCIIGSITYTAVTSEKLSDFFNLGVDFSAGLNLQVKVESNQANESSIKSALSSLANSARVQPIADEDNRFIIRVKFSEELSNFQEQTQDEVIALLVSEFGSGVELESTEFVDGAMASATALRTLLYTVAALLLILIYIWVRFKLKYAISAIAAIFHDVLFMIGVISFFQFEVTTATIAAVLTIIGYSLNDTIVIFDRIRENADVLKEEDFEKVINTSVTQSLSRTLITSFTTFVAVLAIFIFAKGAIQNFALNLMIGVGIGTYSSIFIASTLLLAWHNSELKKIAKKVEQSKIASTSSPKLTVVDNKKSAEPVPKMTAEEIAEATARKKKLKEKKKKKKK